MDLQIATRRIGSEARLARFAAMLCFGVACGFLAATVTEQSPAGSSPPAITGSVSR